MVNPFALSDSALPVSGQDMEFLCQLCIAAGRKAVAMRDDAELQIKQKVGEKKNDLITSADEVLSEILLTALKQKFPHDAIFSEEAAWQQAASGQRRWLIDPIDGTREYVNRTGRWSVMLGLLNAQPAFPVFGCFFVPDQNLVYFGCPYTSSWKMQANNLQPEQLRQFTPLDLSQPTRVLISKNDLNEHRWLTNIPRLEIITGSSIGLDITEILNGNADVFVHIRPTLMAWDTAAPAAVALGAGLEIGTENGVGIPYQTKTPKHDPCIVIGKSGCLTWWQAVWANKPRLN